MFFRTGSAPPRRLSQLLARTLHTVPLVARISKHLKFAQPPVNSKGNDGDPKEPGGDEHDEKEDLWEFDAVFERVNFGRLPAYALAVRKFQIQAKSSVHDFVHDLELADLECDLAGKPLYGSFHILFPLTFSDGVKWILKVPASGHQREWGPGAANALRIEALWMRKLSSETTIPIPTVHAFDTSLFNELNCPFILMDYMEGIPLYKGWFDGDPGSLEKFRARALESVASAMVQLRAYRFPQSGTPRLDDSGNILDISPTRIYDSISMYDRSCNRSFGDSSIQYPDDALLFCDLGPFPDARAQLLHLLDWHTRSEISLYSNGLYELLRLVIQWLPEDVMTGDSGFVLTHPDLAVQNVLVSENGTLTGLIDWDGVTASSVMHGCMSYPLWLTRDWTAQMYNYDPATGGPKIEWGEQENTPEELAYYRSMYSQFMERLAEGNEPSNDQESTFHPSCTEHSAPTRKSLLLAALDLAVKDPMSTMRVAVQIFDEIKRLTSPKWQRFIAHTASEEDFEFYYESDTDDESSESDEPEMDEVASADQLFDDSSQAAGCCEGLSSPVFSSSEEEKNSSSHGLASRSIGASIACAKDCSPYFCQTHWNIKLPSTFLKGAHLLHSFIEKPPSLDDRPDRAWLKLHSLIHKASDQLGYYAKQLPHSDAPFIHVPHALMRISHKVHYLAKHFYIEESGQVAQIEPHFSLMRSLISSLSPSHFIRKVKGIPSTLALLSRLCQRGANLLHNNETRANTTEASRSVWPAFSWLCSAMTCSPAASSISTDSMEDMKSASQPDPTPDLPENAPITPEPSTHANDEVEEEEDRTPPSWKLDYDFDIGEVAEGSLQASCTG